MSQLYPLSCTAFSASVLEWFDQFGRKDLPWQHNTTPYRVWVSEIMLQQTQVATVIPYYQRFMQRFPDLRSLAEAEQDEVLTYWAGLGYYARGRNLHAAAQKIMAEHGGVFPSTMHAVEALPGIGRSTAGAILSLASGQVQTILDGNVKRVLTRVLMTRGWPGQTKVHQQLWEDAIKLTPSKRTADYNQAMMDLGATLCTRSKPDCIRCPVQRYCRAHHLDTPTRFPNPKPKKKVPVRQCFMLLLVDEQKQSVWLEKRPPAGIWGGLWSLPQFESLVEVDAWLAAKSQTMSEDIERWAAFRHTFSHFHLDIQPMVVRVNSQSVPESLPGTTWYMGENRPGGFAAPVEKLLNKLFEASLFQNPNIINS